MTTEPGDFSLEESLQLIQRIDDLEEKLDAAKERICSLQASLTDALYERNSARNANKHLREGLACLSAKMVDAEAASKKIVNDLCDRLLKIDDIVYGPGSADDKVQMIAEWSGGFCKMPAEASDLPVIHESTTRDDLNARFRGRKRVRAPEDDFNAPSEDL